MDVTPPHVGRFPLLDPSPVQPGFTWPATAFDGEVTPFGITSFREGHDLIAVFVDVVEPAPGDGTERPTSIRMRPGAPGTDRWLASHRMTGTGDARFRFRALSDDFATWLHNAEIKLPAGLDEEVVCAQGAEILTRAAAAKTRSTSHKRLLRNAAKALLPGVTAAPPLERFAAAASPEVRALLEAAPVAALESTTEWMPLRVERTLAGAGSWYEFFPRSEGAVQSRDGGWTSGTFRTAAERLPGVAEMGFDVLYLPPIHPIGLSGRKGPNNALTAEPGEPGSPWAIGGAAGGHDAIHPDLGTEDDFRYFLDRAQDAGLEVALDLALQASPDHPWVTEHPEFFTVLPDGSIAYAENPPKKYQDIYPINFDRDPEGIRTEVLRIVRHWMSFGIRIFRVDNPHTKPVAFWEWLIDQVHADEPDVVFLAEAFTRPAMMQALARVGFQQSYTYFTWRNDAAELTEFVGELNATADFLRPNLFVNTPDILTEFLQYGGPGAFTIRATLAATLAPTWGVYAGFELFESVARPGAEESIDNEKYEYRPRDWAGAAATGRTLAPYITALNGIRREHPALGQLRNTVVHWSDDPAVFVFSKRVAAEFTETGVADTIIVVVNVDPYATHETMVHLDLAALGLEPGSTFEVTDLVTRESWTWGEHDYVRLDGRMRPAHILHVTEGTR